MGFMGCPVGFWALKRLEVLNNAKIMHFLGKYYAI
jgi:hypothetical protein